MEPMEQAKPKRKTKTSSAVKNRYNAKAYGTIKVQLPKALVEAYRAKCAAEGITLTQVIRKAIEDYLSE